MSLTSPAPGLSDDASGLRDHAYDWALVDVETSGLIARRDRVLSVAVVTLGPDGEPTGEFSTLLNPGCDPGPVEVHGLTAERLRGAPGFDQVAGRIGAMLQGRVLVAHNAQFDYDFLAHEFARVRMWLPVTQRLCTLALNRRVDPPTEDLTLDSLAAHYGARGSVLAVPGVPARFGAGLAAAGALLLRAEVHRSAHALGEGRPVVGGHLLDHHFRMMEVEGRGFGTDPRQGEEVVPAYGPEGAFSLAV